MSFAYGFVVGIRGDIPQFEQTKQRAQQRDGVIYDSTGKRVFHHGGTIEGGRARVRRFAYAHMNAPPSAMNVWPVR